MDDSRRVSLVFATVVTFLFSMLLVIAKELNEGLKELLVTIGGHHWVGHGIVMLVLFGILAMVPGRSYTKKGLDAERGALYVVAAAVLSGFGIFLFFLNHYLGG